MADNYLEKKYGELRQGKTIIRRVNPSLDSLLEQLGSEQILSQQRAKQSNQDCQQNAEQSSPDAIKQAQIDAIIHAAKRLRIDFEASVATPEQIVFSACSEVALGQILLAASLKAAELKIHSQIELSPASLSSASRPASSATLLLSKKVSGK